MGTLVWVAAGGALGASLRYGMVSLALRVLGPAFPWGTLLVNVLGSLAIGVLWALAEKHAVLAGAAAFLFVGVLGSFTTFSTFAIETMSLLRDGRHLAAMGNVVFSNATCLAAAWIGLRAGQAL